MSGPIPKDPSVRARRNKTSTAATLRADAAIVAPELPAGVDWHPLTVEWWRDLWASPMAPEYVEADRHGMFRVAMLVNDFWCAETPKERAELQVRLEKGDADFGTNPMARRRLQWEIERTEDAVAKGSKRRASASGSSGSKKGDPRGILRAL